MASYACSMGYLLIFKNSLQEFTWDHASLGLSMHMQLEYFEFIKICNLKG